MIMKTGMEKTTVRIEAKATIKINPASLAEYPPSAGVPRPSVYLISTGLPVFADA